MSKTISEFIGVSVETFEATGAFDAILEIDSKFYIDPLLLKGTSAPELSGSYQRLNDRFGEILKLLALSKRANDVFWRQADRQFPTRELKGLCIGYSASGTGGSGMGPMFRSKILSTAKEIVDAGVNDPAIFGLVGVLEEGIGSDRISDMVGRIISEDLLVYSDRIYKDLGAKTQDVKYGEKIFHLPVNPHNKWPILLVPTDVLRPLPIARSYDDIEQVCEYNRRLRMRVNAIIGSAGAKMSTGQKKRAIRKALMLRADILKQFIKDYTEVLPPRYDFSRDPLGEVRWHREARRYVQDHPVELKLGNNPTADEVLAVVMTICDQFRDLIENNSLHELLYEAPRKPKHESAAQKIFYGIAESYCKANNLDLSAEINSGRGAVDFKISRGYQTRVITEIKLTTHTRLKHGFETQLEEYQKAEKTNHAIFLAIHVLGGSLNRIKEVQKIIAIAKTKGERVPELVLVKAIPKPPASKYKLEEK